MDAEVLLAAPERGATPSSHVCRPDQRCELALHQGLGQPPDPFPQHVPVLLLQDLLLQELANERRQIHPCCGYRHRPPCGVLFTRRTHGTMRDGRLPCPAQRPPESPPRPGILTDTTGHRNANRAKLRHFLSSGGTCRRGRVLHTVDISAAVCRLLRTDASACETECVRYWG